MVDLMADTSMPERTPAWKIGFAHASERKAFKPDGLDEYLYTEGFRSGQAAIGVPLEQAIPHRPARPIPEPPQPMSVMLRQQMRTKAWQDGWADSYRGGKTFEVDRDEKLYNEGFEAGVMRQYNSQEITVNQARKLLGMPDLQETVTETLSATTFDPPILFDPVKVPQHYNTGKIEVANFIADQGLDYVRGNVIKYVSRAGKKNPDKELEDLEKAAAYLQMAYNVAQGKPAVVRDPETKEVVWSLFVNDSKNVEKKTVAEAIADGTFMQSEGPYYPN